MSIRLPRRIKKQIRKFTGFSGKITYWTLDGKTIVEIRDGSEFESNIIWQKFKLL